MTKCPKNYKNLGLDTFGNKKKVTEEMLSQFCKNDSFLKNQINQIWDCTNPETRIWQNKIPYNAHESFSILEGTTEVTDEYGNISTKNCFLISDNTTFSGSSAFKNFNTIDIAKTTARIDTANGCAEIPVNTQTANVDACKNLGPWGNMHCNEYWYVGWNRANTYTPDKFKGNPNSSSVPSVARGQTFVPTVTGKLRTITLNLKGHADAEYPLIVEIYKFPKASATTIPLAREEYRFSTTSQALVAINFKSPPNVTKDTKYAVVVRSPLTSYEKAYAIGGWSNACYTTLATGDTYPAGGTYLSEDNAYHWISHGKLEDVPYHEGAEPPFDFAFGTVIEVTTSEYPTNKDYEVVFKTQRMNPITYAKITPTQVLSTGGTITWYISQDGRNWIQLKEANNYSTTFETEDNPHNTYMFLKAVLRTTNKAYTPQINYISIHCDTLKASKAYLKTELFKPRTSPMLGASIWSNCYLPYIAQPNTSVKCDLYRDMLVRDRFTIINPKDIINYPLEAEFVKEYYYRDRYNQIHQILEDDVITAVDMTDDEAKIIANVRSTTAASIKSKYTDNHYLNLTDYEAESVAEAINTLLSKVTDDKTANEFITKYPLLIIHLRKHDIYITGTYQIPLKNSSIYPVHYASFKPTDSAAIALTENIDYLVEYDTETFQLSYNGTKYDLEDNDVSYLTFLNPDETQVSTTEKNSLYKLVPGDFLIEYNPVWIKGLTMGDFKKLDEDGNEVKSKDGYTIYNGFKLDVMTEKIVITKTKGLIDPTYMLRIQPLNALRKVMLNADTDDEAELYEDIDFTVDYDNKKIQLKYDNFNEGDIITVKYTPNLTDTGLGVAYRLSRTNTDNQAYILPSYFTTRT